MKILKIFGVVVAVHVLAFVVIFANPGCRSTPSSKPETTAASIPATSAGGDEYVPVTPVNMGDPGAADGFAPMVSLNTQPEGRFAPTRPGGVNDASAEVIPASVYVVQKGDSLWTIARKNGITTAELAATNNIQANATLQIGQKLLVPAKGHSQALSASSSPSSDEMKSYTVKSGDTLTTIASKHGTTIAAIRSANNLRSDIVRVGQYLKIPDTTATAVIAPRVQTATAPEGFPSATGTSVHVVKMGDTLGAISLRYKVSVADIAKANNITDPTRIRIGQELVIPGAGAASAAPAAAAPAPAPVPAVPVRASDLDAALPPDFIDAPVIQVEDPGAPKIE